MRTDDLLRELEDFETSLHQETKQLQVDLIGKRALEESKLTRMRTRELAEVEQEKQRNAKSCSSTSLNSNTPNHFGNTSNDARAPSRLRTALNARVPNNFAVSSKARLPIRDNVYYPILTEKGEILRMHKEDKLSLRMRRFTKRQEVKIAKADAKKKAKAKARGAPKPKAKNRATPKPKAASRTVKK